MGYKKIELTIRERAAALLFVYGIETSPAKLYTIAHRDSLETVEGLVDLRASASRWLHSEKVQTFIQKENAVLESRRDQERKGLESEILARVQASRDDTLDGTGLVDYSVPRNQLRKLNSLINSSKDSGEALDALKVMIAKQSELAPEKRMEAPVRAYVPLTCHKCPLYHMAGDILKLRASINYDSRTTEIKTEIDEKLRAGGRSIIEEYVEKLLYKRQDNNK